MTGARSMDRREGQSGRGALVDASAWKRAGTLVWQHKNKVIVLQASADVDVPKVGRAGHVEENKARPCQRLDDD